MSPGREYAIHSLDDLAEIWVRVTRERNTSTTDAATRKASDAELTKAQARAAAAMRMAVSGPEAPGNWANIYDGNRALAHNGQLFVLIEPTVEVSIDEPTIIIVPLAAIAGLEGRAS